MPGEGARVGLAHRLQTRISPSATGVSHLGYRPNIFALGLALDVARLL
jgi:hypothetical protein